MLQFVLRWENDSVAARKIDTSCSGESPFKVPEYMALGPDVEGMAFGSCDEVFRAGLDSILGDGGGVG